MADDVRQINEAYQDNPFSQYLKGAENYDPEEAEELTPADKQLIINALWVITPLGGGSPQFHLAQQLEQKWNIEHDPRKVGHLQIRVTREVQGEMEEMEISSLDELEAGIDK
jgi:hypothetical protein